MQIKKIKLNDGGFKGAEIMFLKPEEKKNKVFNNEITEKRKNPIHYDMEKPFKDLRYHLLLICGVINTSMEKTELDFTIADSEVVSIKFDDESFVITGTMKSAFGSKTFKIETPAMTGDDGYDYYDAVRGIIDQIVVETELYMNSKKEVSPEEMAVRYIAAGKDKDVSADVFEGMSMEEKKEYCKNLLEEKFGMFVMENEDLQLYGAETVEEANDKIIEIPLSAHGSDFPTKGSAGERMAEILLDTEEIIIPLGAGEK
jgi:hypothetical protein